MTDLDDRLSRALERAGRPPHPHGVVERVAARRARRRATRRAATVLTAVAVTVAAATGVAWLIHTGGPSDTTVTAAPPPADLVRVEAGAHLGVGGAAVPTRVDGVAVTPDQGYLRGPLLATAGQLSFAAYDRAGDSFTFPPSHIVTVPVGRGSVARRIDLKAEIRSVADGEGARWAITKNPDVVGGPREWFLKRIAADGSVVSTLIPLGDPVTGAVAPVGGGVWVPVRDGVLRFDPATGLLAGRVALSVSADSRAVAGIGKAAWVTDGPDLRRLDPRTDAAVESRPVTIDGTTLLSVVTTDNATWALTAAGRDGHQAALRILVDQFVKGVDSRPGSARIALPRGANAIDLGTAGSRVWVDTPGRFLLIDPTAPRIARTVVTPDRGAALTWAAPRDLYLLARGRLYRARLAS